MSWAGKTYHSGRRSCSIDNSIHSFQHQDMIRLPEQTHTRQYWEWRIHRACWSMLYSAERSWSTASFRYRCLQKQDLGRLTVQVDPAPENAGTHVAGSQWAGVISHYREWEIISKAHISLWWLGGIEARGFSSRAKMKQSWWSEIDYLRSSHTHPAPLPGIQKGYQSDYSIRQTRQLTAISCSTYLVPVLWTTVLSHCSYSEARRGKNGETHYAERMKTFEN